MYNFLYKSSMKLSKNLIEINRGCIKFDEWLKNNPDKIPTFKVLYECLNISALYIRSLTNYVSNNYINNNYEYIPTLLKENNNDNNILKEILIKIKHYVNILKEEFWYRCINGNNKYLSPKLIELYYSYFLKDNNTSNNNNKIILNINIDKNNTNK